jgi:GDP-D-mannose 3',5'-epimerase
MKTALVLGVGFIGTHLVSRLKKEGYFVRGVDIKEPPFGHECDEFLLYDLRQGMNMQAVMKLEYMPYCQHIGPVPFNYNITAFTERHPFDELYVTAALMGGANFIFTGDNDADIISSSAAININAAVHANIYGVKKIFFCSSACVYPKEIQTDSNNTGLKESDAWPSNPDSVYGIEKLFSEQMYLSYCRNYNMNIRIARFHNIYGPLSDYNEPKAKAPAAICRKTIESNDVIKIIGDGEQTRSFLYIDDCIDAVRLLMQSDFKEPINIGSEEMVSINELAKLAMFIGNKDLKIEHIDGPTGVRGRNSNNDLIRNVLNWEPKFSLAEGLSRTYHWIESQMKK